MFQRTASSRGSSTSRRPVPNFGNFHKSASRRSFWPLDRHVAFLNHGSFGSCPNPVLDYQRELRGRLEKQPVQFLVRDLEGLWDDARSALAQFVGADSQDLVFVPNATIGVNTVLRSLKFKRGDELLVTNHEYNACRNALNHVAQLAGLRVAVADVPFPLASQEQVVDAVLSRVSRRTRLALLDHVTSQTGLVFPISRLVEELNRRGVDALVDGAHAPGMVPVNLKTLGAAFYTGNCHKWLCAPKGAGFLHVRRDLQPHIRPLSISHGANSTRRDRTRFQTEFGWTGTFDPSAFLCVPKSLKFIGEVFPGGWQALMERNHRLAIAARSLLCNGLQIEPPCPEDMIGSIASLPLPDATSSAPPLSPLYADPLHELLLRKHRIEVPVIPWPAPPKRLLRISAQLYNSLSQYEQLLDALRGILLATKTRQLQAITARSNHHR